MLLGDDKESHGRKSRFPEVAALFTLLILAIVLRLTFVTGVVFFDDAAYAQAAHDATKGIVHLGPWGGLPRLAVYMPVALMYALFGVGDTTTLVWPLFCSLLSVAIAYGIGRLVAGEAAGILAGFLRAIFPLDIQMATALLPDAPLATFTAATVLFFLLGVRYSERRPYLYFALSILCFVVAMLLKPSALIVLTFLIAYLVWKRPTRKTWLVVSMMVIIAGALFMYYALVPGQLAMIETPLPASSSDSFLTTLASTATDWFVTLIQSRQFFFFIPLFIIAIAGSLFSGQRQTTELVLWGGITFLYFELGTMSPTRYLPIPSDLMLRQILFVLFPFVVMAGVYLAQGMTVHAVRSLTIMLCIIVGSTAWASGHNAVDILPGPFETLSGICAAVAIFGAVASPLIIQLPTSRWKIGAICIFLLCLALAALNPIQRSSVSSIHQVNQRLKRVAEFISTRVPNYSVMAQDGVLATRLDYQAAFLFGFDQFASPALSSTTKLTIAPVKVEQIKEAYVLIDKLSQAVETWRTYPDFISHPPSNWREVARWGEEPYPTILYRVLGENEVALELQKARAAVRDLPNSANLLGLLEAANNANDSCALAFAWQQLMGLTVKPSVNDKQLAQAIATCYAAHPEFAGDNLFQNAKWGHDPAWRMAVAEMISDADGSSPAWRFVYRASDDYRTIAQGGIQLQPNTPYVFEAEVKSTGPLRLLYRELSDGTNAQLSSGVQVYPQWTRVSQVFMTPNWDGFRSGAFFPILFLGEGEAWISDIRLAALQFKDLQQ